MKDKVVRMCYGRHFAFILIDGLIGWLIDRLIQVSSCFVLFLNHDLKWRSSVIGSYPQWQAKEPQGR